VKKRHYSEAERREGIRKHSERLKPRYHMKTWLQTDWLYPTDTREPAVRELTRLLGDEPGRDAMIGNFRLMGIPLSEAPRRLGRSSPSPHRGSTRETPHNDAQKLRWGFANQPALRDQNCPLSISSNQQKDLNP
jgi:hypothetical protein